MKRQLLASLWLLLLLLLMAPQLRRLWLATAVLLLLPLTVELHQPTLPWCPALQLLALLELLLLVMAPRLLHLLLV